MAYKVLALKWRPNNFEEIIGQEHITKALQNAIKFNRVSHAFTFSGPRGVGKTTTARILAKELNKIDNIESSFDIIEMDAASNRGIDEIRSLRENVSIAPAHGKYKIYIIDEVHMLTKEAFNALLKTLEEPPEYVIFVLATTDPYKMPSTILSRTQKYDFRRLSVENIKKQMIIILNSENIKFDELGLELIARKADGSMRDALGYLDQVINYCGKDLKFEDIKQSLGVVDDELYLSILDNIYKNNSSEVVSILRSTMKEGIAVHEFVAGFNRFLRFILNHMISYEANHMNYIKDWLNQNIDIKQLDIIRLMEFLLKFELKIKFLNQPDLALEVLMIKLCNLDSLVNVSAIIEALDNDIKSNISKKENVKKNNIENEKIEDEISTPDISKKSINSNIPKKEDVKKNNIENEKIEDEISTPDISKKSINSNKDIEVEKQNITSVSIISKEGVREKLDDIMNLIDEKNSKTAGFMNDVDVLDVNGSTITILINNISDFLYDTLLNDINLIKESFNIILDTDHNIIIKKGTELVKKEDKSKKNTKDEEHPLFMDALEKFDGQILR